ncbi:HigA family addiction module antitoxin [Mesorhizobium sp. KR2-14]|uniref:HigA family addiction module antitoxin n=1 Tax=Mesorhizobium sp. KR2-14 TaxID=3156610 RepID=UPI0032B4D4D6
MTDYRAVADGNRPPIHAGDVIADILLDLDKNKSEIAGMLGISRQQFHAILAGRKPVTPESAARLGKLFGNGPGFWLRLQADVDAWHALREVDVSSVPTIKAA